MYTTDNLYGNRSNSSKKATPKRSSISHALEVEPSPMRKFTKSIKQYKAQIENMRNYLKELEQKKFCAPGQQNSTIVHDVEHRYQSLDSSLKRRSYKSNEPSPARSGSNRR